MVHLGNHPEVAVCIRCVYSLKTWAWEIADRPRTGLRVNARNGFRSVRRGVIRKSLHQNEWIGRPTAVAGPQIPGSVGEQPLWALAEFLTRTARG